MKRALIDRYTQASRYVAGDVLDLACGFGMGSKILAGNKVVNSVLGMDADPEVVTVARAMVTDTKVQFEQADLDACEIPSCDWVVTLETVEHLLEPLAFLNRIKQVVKKGVVVSVPITRTTHRNKYHLHDFIPEQVDGWFQGWQKIHDGRLVQMINKTPKVLGKIGVYEKPEVV